MEFLAQRKRRNEYRKGSLIFLAVLPHHAEIPTSDWSLVCVKLLIAMSRRASVWSHGEAQNR